MYIIGYFKFGEGSRFLKEYGPDGYSFDWGRGGAIETEDKQKALQVRDYLADQIPLGERDELFVDKIGDIT